MASKRRSSVRGPSETSSGRRNQRDESIPTRAAHEHGERWSAVTQEAIRFAARRRVRECATTAEAAIRGGTEGISRWITRQWTAAFHPKPLHAPEGPQALAFLSEPVGPALFVLQVGGLRKTAAQTAGEAATKRALLDWIGGAPAASVARDLLEHMQRPGCIPGDAREFFQRVSSQVPDSQLDDERFRRADGSLDVRAYGDAWSSAYDKIGGAAIRARSQKGNGRVSDQPADVPLTAGAAAIARVLCSIPSAEARTAKELVVAAEALPAPHRVNLDDQAVRGRLFRELKPWGMQSKVGRGYYIPASRRERLLAHLGASSRTT